MMNMKNENETLSGNDDVDISFLNRHVHNSISLIACFTQTNDTLNNTY